MPKFVLEDGRAFTDYNPNCEINNAIQKKYKVTDSHEYRAFLQNNAEKLMKELSSCYEKENCKVCPVCDQALNYNQNQK
jgi:hypothetical protein